MIHQSKQTSKKVILMCIHGYSLQTLPPHIRKSHLLEAVLPTKEQGKVFFTSNT